jgi:hypothetical protein
LFVIRPFFVVIGTLIGLMRQIASSLHLSLICFVKGKITSFSPQNFWQNVNQCGHKITSFSPHNFGKTSINVSTNYQVFHHTILAKHHPMWAQTNKFFITQFWQNSCQCGHKK